MNPKYITVHCAYTKPSMDIGVKEIRDWHVNGNSWKNIGYHNVIRFDGTIEDGRPYDVQGAHVAGHNANNIGICLVGGMSEDGKGAEDNFTPEQMTSLRNLIEDLMEKFNIPLENVKGHNEWSGAEGRGCPCFDFRGFIQTNFIETNEPEQNEGLTVIIPKGVKEITLKFEQ